MSILGGVYTSLTGLQSYSKALDTISNNVSNLNTPGFKSADLFFRDIGPGSNSLQNHFPGDTSHGSNNGVEITGTTRRFTQGEIRSTGVDTNLAIDGSGFFVLKKDGEIFYTRAGQFEFSTTGQLQEASTKAVVQALNSNGRLVDLKVSPGRTKPPTATDKVTFTGNLSLGSSTHQISQLNVIDSNGQQRTLSLVFTNNNLATPGSWTVQIKNSDSTTIANGEIRFQGNGSPAEDFNTIEFTLPGQTGGANTQITLDFGTPGSFDAATSFSGGTTSTLKVNVVNGFAAGSLQSIAIDEKGVLQLTFTNSQTEEGPRVALASFRDPQNLIEHGVGLFTAATTQKPVLGKADDGGLGKIRSASIELSNVDLSSEFADIIILQRGFQASSQVLNVTSQLIEQVYNSVSGK